MDKLLFNFLSSMYMILFQCQKSPKTMTHFSIKGENFVIIICVITHWKNQLLRSIFRQLDF